MPVSVAGASPSDLDRLRLAVDGRSRRTRTIEAAMAVMGQSNGQGVWAGGCGEALLTYTVGLRGCGGSDLVGVGSRNHCPLRLRRRCTPPPPPHIGAHPSSPVSGYHHLDVYLKNTANFCGAVALDYYLTTWGAWVAQAAHRCAVCKGIAHCVQLQGWCFNQNMARTPFHKHKERNPWVTEIFKMSWHCSFSKLYLHHTYIYTIFIKYQYQKFCVPEFSGKEISLNA